MCSHKHKDVYMHKSIDHTFLCIGMYLCIREYVYITDKYD